MKLTNIFKLAVVSSILVFAVGCGKDKNVSGGYMNFNPLNPGQGTDIVDANAIAGYNSLLQWRNQLAQNPQQERNLLGRGIGFSKGDFSSTNQNTSVPSGCKELFKIFGKPFYSCDLNQVGNNPISADLVTMRKCTRVDVNGRVFSANASNINFNGCAQNGEDVAYSIGTNTELNQLLSGEKGKIITVQFVPFSSFVEIRVGARGNYTTPATHIYLIDTAIHSIYNPVGFKEIGTNKVNMLFQAF